MPKKLKIYEFTPKDLESGEANSYIAIAASVEEGKAKITRDYELDTDDWLDTYHNVEEIEINENFARCFN